MIEKLLNLNIKNCSDSELKTLIRQTLAVVAIHSQAVEELLRRGNDANNEISAIEMADQPIATANGRRLSHKEFMTINKNNFDIILDLTVNRLFYRQDPTNHSALKEAVLNGIGPRRIEILMYLLEHPKQHISVENISKLSNQCDAVMSNTLSQTICLLRKALGQKDSKGPYLITEPSLGSPYHIYKIDRKWNYLVIKNKNHR